MQKLKNSVLDSMLQANLTKAEVDFLLEASHYQDEKGRVHGIHYRTFSEAIGISYETFYVTMRSLADKGFIEYSKDYIGDWNVIIRNNDFSYPDAMKEGYINTGHDIFFNKHFKELKAKEKLLALQFLKIGGAGKRYHIGVELLFEKYAKLLQVTKRTIRVYLTRLKAFFSIGIKNHMYWITPLVAVFKDQAPSDIGIYSRHLVDVAMRRNRAAFRSEQDEQDTIGLIRQYFQTLKEETARIFLGAVTASMEQSNAGIRKTNWDRDLNPKFIHKLIRNAI